MKHLRSKSHQQKSGIKNANSASFGSREARFGLTTAAFLGLKK
jgi:hypothetical protein